MPFHLESRCAVSDETIYLCFHSEDLTTKKQCHVGTDPVGSFLEVTESQFVHSETRIGSSEGKN